MSPQENRKDRRDMDETGPGYAQKDWDDAADISNVPEAAEDVQQRQEQSGELPGEDDDNPFQESDEALPDDLEEAVLRKDPSKEGGRFDEI